MNSESALEFDISNVSETIHFHRKDWFFSTTKPFDPKMFIICQKLALNLKAFFINHYYIDNILVAI